MGAQFTATADGFLGVATLEPQTAQAEAGHDVTHDQRRDALGDSFAANVDRMRRFVRFRLLGRVGPDRVADGIDWCVSEASLAASEDCAADVLGDVGWCYWRRELFAAVGRFASMDAAGLRRPMRQAVVGEDGADSSGRVYRVGVDLPELLSREPSDDQPFDGIRLVVDALGGKCSQADINLLAVIESFPDGSSATWAAALDTTGQAVRMRTSRMRRRLAEAGCV